MPKTFRGKKIIIILCTPLSSETSNSDCCILLMHQKENPAANPHAKRRKTGPLITLLKVEREGETGEGKQPLNMPTLKENAD